MRRREVLIQAAAAIGAAGVTKAIGAAAATAPVGYDNGRSSPFRISLNTATLRGHKLPIVEVIEIAAQSGYQGIEPWVDELDRHVASGGTLSDLRKRIEDRGLTVTGVIAFFAWMVDDDARRAQGLQEAERRMQQVGAIGGTHIAAPPVGDVGGVSLLKGAERYRTLLELSEKTGVVPAVEIWGSAANLFRLGQAVAVALEAQHPKACVLPDVFHLYKGGSGLGSIRRLNADLLAGFHLNDYPAAPPREIVGDKDRVFPGDGVAPLPKLIRDLLAIGYRGPLSIELFNPAYAQRDPLKVAQEALAKTQAVVRQGMDLPA